MALAWIGQELACDDQATLSYSFTVIMCPFRAAVKVFLLKVNVATPGARCRGMVEVIAKLREAADQASKAAARLEADACEDGAGDALEACEQYEAAAEAVQEAALASGLAGPAPQAAQAASPAGEAALH